MPRSPSTLRPGRYGRWLGPVAIDVKVETVAMDTLDETINSLLLAHLSLHLGSVVQAIIEDAKKQLFPGHGYLTGLMHDTLLKVYLGRAELGPDMVGYDIGSHPADYWLDVEFGHVTSSGRWWEGYHFMANAFEMHRADLQQVVELAVADTVRGASLVYQTEARAGRGRTVVHRRVTT